MGAPANAETRRAGPPKEGHVGREGTVDHFKPERTIRDSLLTLDVLGSRELYNTLGITNETIVETITNANLFAKRDLAPSYTSSDRNPPIFDPKEHTVTITDEKYRKSFDAYQNSEWRLSGISSEVGGDDCPPSIAWKVREAVLAANPSILMYGCGPIFAELWYEHAKTDADRARAKQIVTSKFGTTMALTEPDAGSNVGAGITSATPQTDGTYHIDGVKRFITNGEHDLTDNIVHYVLARVEGAPDGTEGLSLFAVPKWEYNPENGKRGERNGVEATNIEDKMGLRMSSTAELTFGGEDKKPAKGYLIGEEGQGMALMFQIIHKARMMVAAKSAGAMANAFANAHEYAHQRRQGVDPENPGQQVLIAEHPQVAESLLTQQAYADGMRALVSYAAGIQDRIMLAKLENRVDKEAVRLHEFLLPILKAWNSRKAAENISNESLETFGGSGFLKDYPIEQYVRDQKIDSLYEGTTNIQGLDFVGRQLGRAGGSTAMNLAMGIAEFAQSDAGGEALSEERGELLKGLGQLGLMMEKMKEWGGEGVEGETKAKLNMNRVLFAAGDVIVAWLLQRLAAESARRLEALAPLDGHADPEEKAFYNEKIKVAKHFTRQVMPHLTAHRKIMEATRTDLLIA